MLALTALVIATTLNTAEQPAGTISYQVVSNQRSAIQIQNPYTFGTHDMVAHSVRGGLQLRGFAGLHVGRILGSDLRNRSRQRHAGVSHARIPRSRLHEIEVPGRARLRRRATTGV